MDHHRTVALVIALAAAMVICGVNGRRHRVSLIALALLGIVWLIVDRFFEGPILWTAGAGHGLVFADLFGLAAIAAAALLWPRSRWH